jgi:hypothetical protein
VKAVLACVLVLSVAALAAGVESGHACSCALPDARAALAQADGAFVGRLVARRQEGQSAILTYAVERTLKGPIGPTIEVRTASNGAACGIEAPIGTRAGLVLDRRGGAWNGHLCWQFDADELLTAALPLPPPNGRGQVALIAGGEFGDVRLLALDANGRTLAYGRGGGRTGLVSVCPGRQRIAELAYTGQGTVVVIRRTRTLRILRRQALVLPGRRYAQRLSCGDRTGTSVVVFARGPSGDSPAKSALYDVRAGRLHAIWNGAAFDAALTPSNAFLSAGLRGRNLLRVDLTTGSARVLATLPGPLTALQVNAAATLLAGVETRVDRSAQVAQVFWLPGGRLLFAPTYGRTARVLDESLRTRSRFGWSALSAAVAANELFGTDLSLALYRADLPSGPQRVARSLPGRTHVLVSATR